jgi:hypothetical protein
MVVVGIIGLMAGVSIPFTARTVGDLRMHGDGRAIHNLVGMAKMRAATRSTRERMYVNLTTESFFLQYWDRTAAVWVTEGGATSLSSGVDFGFNGLATPPSDTQPVIKQASACLVALTAGNTIADTACVMFNSRGIPVDAAGSPVGDSAFYLTDYKTGVYAITVSATPLVRLWWSPPSSAQWAHK